MKVLVIGASGMLARPVIQHLDRAGFQLRLFSRTIDHSMFSKSFEIFRGDVSNTSDLETAMDGCDAVHISISRLNEALAVNAIVKTASEKKLALISYVSGASVSEQNRWFSMIDNKYIAEQTIIGSGIPYLIFRPTWFFESLNLMVRNGKAAVLGKQPHPSHWVAGDDFGRMVANAYRKPEAHNKVFYIHGPESYFMKDILGKYCQKQHPEIKKVSSVPLGLLKIISRLTRNKELKEAVDLFSYFEKVPEMGSPEEANTLLGKPETTFDQWVVSRN